MPHGLLAGCSICELNPMRSQIFTIHMDSLSIRDRVALSLLAVVAREKPDENIRAFREYCRIRSLPAAARNPISAGGRYQERETGVENALTFAMRSKLSRMARPSSQNLPRRDFCLAFNANEPTRGLSLQIKPKLTCFVAIDRLSF